MNISRLFILTLPLLFGLISTRCISDEFTTSPHDLLTFSTDSVGFGTIFTEQGTPTARLIVHNRNAQGVRISYIGFADPDTRFRLNVDGFTGSTFSDIEIRANDSIYIFIECYPLANATAEPAVIRDRLEFITNGVTQTVRVEALGQNVTRLNAVTLEQDMVMTAEQPYVVYDSLVVAPGVRLQIEPGTQMLFHDKARLVVRGTLEAEGTPEAPIDMRGDRLDNVLPDVSYDIMAGQWSGVRFTQESFGSRMVNVDMRSTVEGLRVDSCGDLSQRKLLLLNSWIHNSQGRAFDSRHAWVDAYGTVFSEAAEAVVALTGGKHTLTQCTLANYYLFSAIREPMLCLFHLLPDDAEGSNAPLMQASLNNCIIYGMTDVVNHGDLTGSDVYIRTTLLGAAGEDDDNFIDCLWDEDPLFYTVRSDYYFNYHLRPDSPAIGAGNPAYVADICLYDADGLDRLASGAPTLGAYVYQPPKEEARRKVRVR